MILIYLVAGAVVLYVFYWLLAGKSGSENSERQATRDIQQQNSFPREDKEVSTPPSDASDEERRRSAIKNIMDKRAESGNIEPSDAAKVISQWMKKPPKKNS